MRTASSLSYGGLPDRDPLDRDPAGQRLPWTENPYTETPYTETPLDSDPQTETPRQRPHGQRPPGDGVTRPVNVQIIQDKFSNYKDKSKSPRALAAE